MNSGRERKELDRLQGKVGKSNVRHVNGGVAATAQKRAELLLREGVC